MVAELRSNVLGVGVSPLTMVTAVSKIEEAALRPGFKGYVTVTGVHGVMESQRDAELKRVHNRSFLTTPDGMPMVWLARWNGFDTCERVYGPDLMLEVLRGTLGREGRHYLFGGGEGVANLLAERLRERFPSLQIAGIQTPPFRPLEPSEEADLVAELERTRPHCLWVGLSTPKQEKLMHDLLARHPDLARDWDHGLVLLGVGAAFDFHAGLIRQAPRWMQQCGLEWLFRTLMEPRRLWRRYATNNPAFLFRIIPQMMGARPYPLEK